MIHPSGVISFLNENERGRRVQEIDRQSSHFSKPSERLLPRVASRLGLHRVAFRAYQSSQLNEILVSRLKQVDGGQIVLEKDAIDFVTRKVANMHGDVRRLLDICRTGEYFRDCNVY